MNRNNNQDHVLGLQSCLLMLIQICLLTLSDPGCLSDFTGTDEDTKSEQNIGKQKILEERLSRQLVIRILGPGRLIEFYIANKQIKLIFKVNLQSE